MSISRNRFACAAVLGALLLLAGCGGGGGDAAPVAAPVPAAVQPVQLDSTRAVRATLGPAGGSVVAQAADGRVYTLTVPAGALAASTEITATPVTSLGGAPLAAGLKAAVRFGPAGLKFALPATLRIDGANTAAAAGKRLVGFLRSDDGQVLNLQPVSPAGAGAVEMPVPHFSDGGVAEASPAELAAIPLAPIVDPAQEIADLVLRGANGTEANDTALLNRVHDQILLPLLDQAATLADDPAQDAFREAAANAWAVWQLMVDLSAIAPARFGDRVAQARARAGGMLLGQVDRGRNACLASAPVGTAQVAGLRRALWAQQVAQQFRLDATDLGLDATTVARRLNDCARVAFVPTTLPSFDTGRAVSLDVQAELIFAADANARPAAELDFSLASTDAAIASPRGLGDGAGRYTSVVTPRAAGPVFELQACVVTFLSNGAPVAGVVCGRQSLATRGRPVFAGEFSFFQANGARTGGGRLRLQLQADGRFTVLEATGSLATTSTGVVDTCFPVTQGLPNVKNISLTASRSATISGGSQAASLAAGQFIVINLTGESRSVSENLDADCRVVVNSFTTTNAGGVQILSVENDAQGQPQVLVLGDRSGSHSGRLVREP